MHSRSNTCKLSLGPIIVCFRVGRILVQLLHLTISIPIHLHQHIGYRHWYFQFSAICSISYNFVDNSPIYKRLDMSRKKRIVLQQENKKTEECGAELRREECGAELRREEWGVRIDKSIKPIKMSCSESSIRSWVPSFFFRIKQIQSDSNWNKAWWNFFFRIKQIQSDPNRNKAWCNSFNRLWNPNIIVLSLS